MIRLLGPPRIRLGTRWHALHSDRPAALLIYLAHRGEWVHRSELTAVLWPDTTENVARANLRQLLRRMRTPDVDAHLDTRDNEIRLDASTDAERFRKAVAAHAWHRAVRLHEGEFCANFNLPTADEFHAWIDRERAHLSAMWRNAAVHLAADLSAAGKHDDAEQLLTRILDTDELAEDAVWAYLRAAALAGHRTAALQRFERYATTLRDDLGLEPIEPVRALADAIAHGDLVPAWPAALPDFRASSARKASA